MHARFEVLPLRGAADAVAALPRGTTVTVTSSPSRGAEATLDFASTLAGTGLRVVPHLAARLVTDRAHLHALLDRVFDLGLRDVFVVAGDSTTPAGDFPDALSLLRALAESGRMPASVGITGYPERHALIPDGAIVQATSEKARYADYVVTQICYDPHTITSWVKDVRARGLTLPIYIGLPGVVDMTKLLKISMKIGLGDSTRFLRKQHGMVSKLLTSYSPGDVFDGIVRYLDDPEYGIFGWHFFTFNEVSKTVRWRDERIDRLKEVPA